MRSFGFGVAALAVTMSPIANGPARAQDASFGCQVLLCAAASSPSWSGIAYCVPVMESLFHQLAHGGSWPACPEGNASGLGYEPYYPCPDGTTPMQASQVPSAASVQSAPLPLTQSSNGNLCADTSKPQSLCASGNGGSCQTTYPTTPREVRSEPDYVDIASANGTQRFYFSLSGY